MFVSRNLQQANLRQAPLQDNCCKWLHCATRCDGGDCERLGIKWRAGGRARGILQASSGARNRAKHNKRENEKMAAQQATLAAGQSAGVAGQVSAAQLVRVRLSQV